MGTSLVACGIGLHLVLLLALGLARVGGWTQFAALAVQIAVCAGLLVYRGAIWPGFWSLACLVSTPAIATVPVFYPDATLVAVPYLFLLVMYASKCLRRRAAQLVTGESLLVAVWAVLLGHGSARLTLAAVLSVGGVLLATHRVLLRAADVEEAVLQRLDRAARIDGLTQSLARTAFDDAVDAAIRHGDEPAEEVVSVLVIDVDHFKDVNDRHGHLVGDEALIQIARQLRAGVRDSDGIVGRLGGDEFAVLLRGCQPQTALRRAQDLAAEVAAAPLMLANGELVHLTVSIGVTTALPSDVPASGRTAFYAAADRALYQAKVDGRGRAVASAVTVDA